MDDKTKGLLIAAVVGLALAYYLNTSPASQPLSPNGGLLPPPAPPGGGGSPPGGGGSPQGGGGSVGGSTGGGSVVNKAASSRPATPKEKQLGLNWLQALIQKHGGLSIYTPFSASDLATGSFGPKSRAALAKAEQIMRAAYAALPPTVSKNLLQPGAAGDAALQALVDATTLADSTVQPNAPEIQALVKAAGGTAGSIGAGTPAPKPSIIQQQVNPLWVNTSKPTWFLRSADAATIRSIARFCAAVAYKVDGAENMSVDERVLTRHTLVVLRRLYTLYIDPQVYDERTFGVRMRQMYGRDIPSDAVLASMQKPSDYTMIVSLSDGYAARLNPKALEWMASSGLANGIASTLEDALEVQVSKQWAGSKIPNMELTRAEVQALMPDKEIVNG